MDVLGWDACDVILVTGDINLQNKADAAMIEAIEIDFDRPE